MNRVSRRRFLGVAATAVTGGAAAVAVGTGFSWGRVLTPGEPGTLLRSGIALPPPFRVPLPVPPLMRPVRSDASADYYEITQRVSSLEILPGVKTQAWTYGGSFPGPTLASRSGRRAIVKHRNELPRPVAVHPIKIRARARRCGVSIRWCGVSVCRRRCVAANANTDGKPRLRKNRSRGQSR